MQRRYIWISEVVWWLASLLLAVAIIWPYYPALIVDVPFLIPNIILVVIAVQGIRLTFLLRQSIFAQSQWLIFPLTFTFIPVCMYAIKQYSIMNQFFTTSASWMHSFSYLLTLTEKSEIAAYIRTEFTWCAVAAFMAGISVSGRMILASWRILGKKERI